MAGTHEGGLKTRDNNLAKDPNFYKTIGAKGGHASTGGGFAKDHELARRAGRIGGKNSRRTY